MIAAKVIADSLCPRNHRLTTLVVTMPRFILAEFNTHRLFSKNSASSRATPFSKMVKMVEENPFIPMAWQKDHKGMQGVEYITNPEHINLCIEDWLYARDYAVIASKRLHNDVNDARGDIAPVTKQLCNRLLEPFMYHTVIVSATEWLNFFEQRCPQYEVNKFFKSKKECIKKYRDSGQKTTTLDNYSELDWLAINRGQAEIHMMAVAEAIYDALNESTPKQLQEGEWHIPFGDNIRYIALANLVGNDDEKMQKAAIKIAVARCARVSYLNYEGKDDYEADLKLYDSLVKNLHMSPLEHCARVMTEKEYHSFHKGKMFEVENLNTGIVSYRDDYNEDTTSGWCNNFRGFIQQRWEIENEAA